MGDCWFCLVFGGKKLCFHLLPKYRNEARHRLVETTPLVPTYKSTVSRRPCHHRKEANLKVSQCTPCPTVPHLPLELLSVGWSASSAARQPTRRRPGAPQRRTSPASRVVGHCHNTVCGAFSRASSRSCPASSRPARRTSSWRRRWTSRRRRCCRRAPAATGTPASPARAPCRA